MGFIIITLTTSTSECGVDWLERSVINVNLPSG